MVIKAILFISYISPYNIFNKNIVTDIFISFILAIDFSLGII